MIEEIELLGRCWRGAVRETCSGLQVTWHDGSRCTSGVRRQCRHAVVIGDRRRATLDDDCSGRRVRQVVEASSLYTADKAEAEAAYKDALKYARACGRHPGSVQR